jgi:dihydroxyacetone kinase DhaKLM complex PTS-EIIA-like component DhaM
VVYIAEGAATASTIHEVTGKCVIVSFSAQNMTATAKYVRHVSGDQRDIVIVADNDESGTGEREALKACEAAHCTMIMPPVIGDANDYVQAGGDLAALLEPPPQDMTAFAMADAIFVDDIGDTWSGLIKSILIVVNLTKGKIMAACMAAKGPHLKEIAYLTLRLARKR